MHSNTNFHAMLTSDNSYIPLFTLQLIEHFKTPYSGINATNVDILQTINWRYFPRWSPKDIQLDCPGKSLECKGGGKSGMLAPQYCMSQSGQFWITTIYCLNR